MGDGGGKASGGGELCNLQHAPLHLQLLHLAQGSQVSKYGHGVSYLAFFVKDLAGARVILDLLFESGVIEAQRSSLAFSKRKREIINIGAEGGLVLELDGIGRPFSIGAKNLLRQRVNQHDFRPAVTYNDWIAHVLNDHVHAEPDRADYYFGIAQLLIV